LLKKFFYSELFYLKVLKKEIEKIEVKKKKGGGGYKTDITKIN